MEVINKSCEARVCALDELVSIARAAVMGNIKGDHWLLCFIAIPSQARLRSKKTVASVKSIFHLVEKYGHSLTALAKHIWCSSVLASA
jgi:hypothetical protein